MPRSYAQRHFQKQRDNYLAGKRRNNKARTRRTQEWLNKFKSEHPCVCGESDIAALDMHHIDPKTKLRGISECKSIAQLKIEVAKCEPMCSNCHRKGHAGRPRPEHAAFFQAPS